MNDAILNVLITSVTAILTALITGLLTAYTQIKVETIKAKVKAKPKGTVPTERELKEPTSNLSIARVLRSVNWPVTVLLTLFVVTVVVALLYLRASPSSFQRGEYKDFEALSDRQEWTSTSFSLLSLSTEQHFSGNQSLAVSTTDTTLNEEDQIIARWNREFTTEIIVGQIYWPEQEGVALQWAQVCIWGFGLCRNIPVETNQWNNFVISFYGRTGDDEEAPATLYIQAGIKMDSTGSDRYTFFVDSIEIVRLKAHKN